MIKIEKFSNFVLENTETHVNCNRAINSIANLLKKIKVVSDVSISKINSEFTIEIKFKTDVTENYWSLDFLLMKNRDGFETNGICLFTPYSIKAMKVWNGVPNLRELSHILIEYFRQLKDLILIKKFIDLTSIDVIKSKMEIQEIYSSKRINAYVEFSLRNGKTLWVDNDSSEKDIRLEGAFNTTYLNLNDDSTFLRIAKYFDITDKKALDIVTKNKIEPFGTCMKEIEQEYRGKIAIKNLGLLEKLNTDKFDIVSEMMYSSLTNKFTPEEIEKKIRNIENDGRTIISTSGQAELRELYYKECKLNHDLVESSLFFELCIDASDLTHESDFKFVDYLCKKFKDSKRDKLFEIFKYFTKHGSLRKLSEIAFKYLDESQIDNLVEYYRPNFPVIEPMSMRVIDFLLDSKTVAFDNSVVADRKYDLTEFPIKYVEKYGETAYIDHDEILFFISEQKNWPNFQTKIEALVKFSPMFVKTLKENTSILIVHVNKDKVFLDYFPEETKKNFRGLGAANNLGLL